MRNPLYGTWQSDAEMTLAELRRHLRPDHPKIKEWSSGEYYYALFLRYTPPYMYYMYRGEVVRARHRILAQDEHSVVVEVGPTWINEQRLWHIHLISDTCYWVTVDLDCGFIYREFFTKIDEEEEIEPGVWANQVVTWRKCLKKLGSEAKKRIPRYPGNN